LGFLGWLSHVELSKEGLEIKTEFTNESIAVSNKKRGIIAVDICSHHGIGAKLEWVLEILAYCEENKLAPRFKFTYPGQNKEEDYFQSFFEIQNSFNLNDSVEFVEIRSIHELNLSKNYDEILDIELAAELINKYLAVKSNVLHEVDVFCVERFRNQKVLGVHYRGTDKLQEAPLVSYENVEKNINYFLEKFPETAYVFLSSDDENFVKFAENCSIARPVLFRNDTYRSTDNIAIHHSAQNKYDLNRDAIVNCLILSRCDALMKTASILSAWSKLFNPGLRLVMLNKPFNRWFPERDLADEVIYEPIS